MKIVYFGSGKFGVKCLDAIKNSQHQILHIYTQPTQKAGRGKKLKPTDVAVWAELNNVSCRQCSNVNDVEMIGQIKNHKADLLVVIAFGQKICRELISLFPKGAVNVHASLLPAYRGAAPVNWAIIRGETKTGVSIITLADKMDAGEVLAQGEVAIEQGDTAEVVLAKLADISPGVLMGVIDDIEQDRAVYLLQDHSKATKAPKFKKTDGQINWSNDAGDIYNKIRGMWPWPGAYSYYISATKNKSEKVIIAAAEVVESSGKSEFKIAGTLDENLNVTCGKDSLKILKLKPAGKKLMDFKAFVNGRAAGPGDRFELTER